MSANSIFRELVSGRWKGAGPAMLRGTLAVLEVPYRWVVQWRNSRFDRHGAKRHQVAASVISVGNLTVGGTGKTPFVAWLANWLMERGRAVTVISRGYGARKSLPNDEALELAARLPQVAQLQNPDRVAAAKAALQANPNQVLILDDGFQHRRLARELDIVLLDALEPFGHEHLLPRGLLREPVSSLARAQVIALSRSDAVSSERRAEIEARVRAHAPEATWMEVVHQPVGLISASGLTRSLEELRGRRVAAFCGIGNPEGFRHTLERLGLVVAGLLALPDHCSYAARDLASIARWLAALGDIECVLCTRKDLVKITQDEIAGRPLWALDVELQVLSGQAELERLLMDVVQD